MKTDNKNKDLNVLWKWLFIDKTITINADRLRVWDIITKSEYNNKWVNEFSPGMTLESDWNQGSPVVWKESSWKIVVEWDVIRVNPWKFLRFSVFDLELGRHKITVNDGITFELSPKNDMTILHMIHWDFSVLAEPQSYYDMTLEAWNKIFPKIKELAEISEKKDRF